MSDALNANNAAASDASAAPRLAPLALRWTALDPTDTTVAAFLGVNRARDWDDFTAALRQFVAPAQNFVYADVEGHIGYYAPGRIPIRAHGDGARPARGWTGEDEWSGWVPFDELPHTFDPPEHVIVTANNRAVPAGYPYFLTGDWEEPYRAQRIAALLRQHRALGPDDFAAIQADTFSSHADTLLPALLAHARPRSADDARALAILRQWDRDAGADSPGEALFQAWFVALVPALAGDELGPVAGRDYVAAGRTSFISRFLGATLAADDSPWCDDVRTPAHESCDDTVSLALDRAVAGLRARLGGDPSGWRWDAVHRAMFPHEGLDAVRLLRPLVSRSVPTGGDWSTVDVGAVVVRRPFEQHAIASYRQVIDLSPANASRFLDAVGQSGHPLSPHYDDFLPDWRAVRYRPMRMDRADVERGALGHLTLTPEDQTAKPDGPGEK